MKKIIILIISLIVIISVIATTLFIFLNKKDNVEVSYENNVTEQENTEKSNILVVPLQSENEPEQPVENAEENTEENNIYGYDKNAMQVASSYGGFPACGYLEIPKIGLSLPVLDGQTVSGMEYSCCMLYTTGQLNLSGNTYITGHNRNNGRLFSNNKKLEVGDKIILTGLYKNRLEYTIYNIFNTTADDVSYLTKPINEKNIELTLQTCNNDRADTRLIIEAVHYISK